MIITGNFFNELKADQFNKMFELEANFINIDRIVHETDEAKNELETYVYSLRDKIDTTHKDYIEDSKRSSLSTQLTEMSDWIYEEGDQANKTQFLERLKQLKDIGDPMEYKMWEFEHRDQRVTNFKKLVFKYQQWPSNEEEKYAHIGEDKRKEVKKYADDADAWLTNQMIKQDRMKKYETPQLKCKDIDSKYRELYDKCNPIITTPKPKPKPKPKEESKDDKEKDNDKKKEDDNKKDDDNDAEMTDKTTKSADDATTKQDDATKTDDVTTETNKDDATKNDNNGGVDGMDVE